MSSRTSPADLKQQDLRSLLQLVHELDSIGSLTEFPQQVVELMSRVMPADSYSYTELNPLLRRSEGLIVPHDLMSAEEMALFNWLSDEHPVVQHYRGGLDGQALRISDFLSQRSYRETALYRELYRKAQSEFQLACQLPAPAPVVIGVILNRQRRDFNDRECALLDQARPHLQLAYERLLLKTKAQALNTLMEHDGQPQQLGLMLVSRLGAVLAVNERAIAIGERAGWRGLGTGALLPAALLTQFLRLRDVTVPPGTRLSLPTASGTEDLTIEILPTDIGDSAYLLAIQEPLELSFERVQEQLALTRRQVDILLCLSRGASNKGIARELAIAPGTVKKHLEEVYRRLGVENRTAAVAAARHLVESLGSARE